MGTPDFDFLGDSNPRALGKAPGAPCNPRRPAPQSRSNPLSRAKIRSAQMGTPDFDFLGDSNPRALGKAPGAPCNPRRPAPQSRSNPLSRAKTRSTQMGSPGFAFYKRYIVCLPKFNRDSTCLNCFPSPPASTEPVWTRRPHRADGGKAARQLHGRRCTACARGK